MLTSLQLENWKSFGAGERARNEVDFAPLTFLVGPNGSGKSNVLDALRFLQGAALDMPLNDVLRGRYEGGREVWPRIRGQLAEAARGGTDQFTLTSSWCVAPMRLPEANADFTHVISVDTTREALLGAEKLVDASGSYLFDTHAHSLGHSIGRQPGGGVHAALRSKGQGRSTPNTFSSARSLLGQVSAEGRVQADVPERCAWLRSRLKAASFLDIRPAMMRDYRAVGTGLGVNGENISPFLQSLEAKQLETIQDWIEELLPEVQSIEFEETMTRDVMLHVRERSGARVSARSLSDGTLRFLGEVVAVLTAPQGSLLVLEEPDAGLHPSRIGLLAQLLQSAAKRGVQILATTHSAVLLAYLEERALQDAVAFARDVDTGTTVCRRFGALEHFDVLRSSDVDHLISTGWLERAL